MKVVAPEETIGFAIPMTELDAIYHLQRQHDLRKEFAETPASVPTQRLLLDRHTAKACWRPPELFLQGKSILRLVHVRRLRRNDEITFRRTRRRFGLVVASF